MHITISLRSLAHRIGLPILALFVVVAATNAVSAQLTGPPPRNTEVSTTVTLSHSTVKGGTLVTGTVTMTDHNGLFKGATVYLSSSKTAVAKFPASITIPPSSTSPTGTRTFTVTTYKVTANTTVVIGATAIYPAGGLPTGNGAYLTVTP